MSIIEKLFSKIPKGYKDLAAIHVGSNDETVLVWTPTNVLRRKPDVELRIANHQVTLCLVFFNIAMEKSMLIKDVDYIVKVLCEVLSEVYE